MIALGALGIISTFLPWRTVEIPFFGMKLNFKGIDHWPGYVAIIIMAIIVALAIMGKKEEGIGKGVPRMGVLILSGLGFLFGLFLIGAYMMNEFDSPAFGLYLFILASLGALVVPFIFKADGSVHMPSAKEIADDIEDNAEVFEDTVEDFADKIEDKIEERFDKDDDDDDDKKEEEKKEDAPSEE